MEHASNAFEIIEETVTPEPENNNAKEIARLNAKIAKMTANEKKNRELVGRIMQLKGEVSHYRETLQKHIGTTSRLADAEAILAKFAEIVGIKNNTMTVSLTSEQIIGERLEKTKKDVIGYNEFYAARAGDSYTLTKLIAAGCDLAVLDENENFPIYYACVCQQLQALKVMLPHSEVYMNTVEGQKSLLAISSDVMREALRNGEGANHDMRVGFSTKPLYMSTFVHCWDGSVAGVSNLIAMNAELNLLSRGGLAPIDFAAFENHRNIVELMKKNGAHGTVLSDLCSLLVRDGEKDELGMADLMFFVSTNGKDPTQTKYVLAHTFVISQFFDYERWWSSFRDNRFSSSHNFQCYDMTTWCGTYEFMEALFVGFYSLCTYVPRSQFAKVHEKNEMWHMLGLLEPELPINRFKLNSKVRDANRFYFDTPSCDVTFNVGQTTIRAHRAFLCARSQYFKTLLAGNMQEAKQDTIELHADLEVVRKVFIYFYTDTIIANELQQYFDVLALADEWIIPGLKMRIEKCIMARISASRMDEEDIYNLRGIAEMYQLQHLDQQMAILLSQKKRQK